MLLASRKCFTCCVRAQPEFHLPFCRPIRNLSQQSVGLSVSLAVSRMAIARGASLQQSPYYCIPARGALRLLLLPLLPLLLLLLFYASVSGLPVSCGLLARPECAR